MFLCRSISILAWEKCQSIADASETGRPHCHIRAEEPQAKPGPCLVPEDAGGSDVACHGPPPCALSGVATERVRYERVEQEEAAGEIELYAQQSGETGTGEGIRGLGLVELEVLFSAGHGAVGAGRGAVVGANGADIPTKNVGT